MVSEYQPGRGEKRGTLTFERSDLHPERQTAFDNKRGHFRFGESGSRQSRDDRNRDGRGKDMRENSSRKENRLGFSRQPDAAVESVISLAVAGFTPGSDTARTNAWSQPLQGTKQTLEPSGMDEIPDIVPWNEPSADGALSPTEDKTLAGTLPDKPEESSRLAETPGNDRDLVGKQGRFRSESSRADYHGDRGQRQPRRGRRQNWGDLMESGENLPSRYL